MQMVDMTKVKSDDYAMPMSQDCCPCIYLSDEQVEALGIKGMPAPGTAFTLQAHAVVTSMTARAEEASEAATEGTAPDVSLSIKLVAMAMTPAGTTDSDRASVLYGE